MGGNATCTHVGGQKAVDNRPMIYSTLLMFSFVLTFDYNWKPFFYPTCIDVLLEGLGENKLL